MKNLGFMISSLRKKYNITVSSLAEDICSPKYIYLIEKGEREPSIGIVNAINKKLNYQLFPLFDFVNFNDPVKSYELFLKYDNLRRNNSFDELNLIIRDYVNEDDIYILQMNNYYNACVSEYYRDYFGAKNYIKEALKFSYKDLEFDEEKIEECSLIEIKSYVLLAKIYCRINNEELGNKIFRTINNYLDKIEANYIFRVLKMEVGIEYSKRLYIAKEYDRAIELLNKLMKYSDKYYLDYLKERLLYQLASVYKSINDIQQAEKYLRQLRIYIPYIKDKKLVNKILELRDNILVENTDINKGISEFVKIDEKGRQVYAIYIEYGNILKIKISRLITECLTSLAHDIRMVLKRTTQPGTNIYIIVDCINLIIEDTVITSTNFDDYFKEMEGNLKSYPRVMRVDVFRDDIKELPMAKYIMEKFEYASTEETIMVKVNSLNAAYKIINGYRA